MGNEFTAEDFAPHLGYGFTLPVKIDVTATGPTTVVSGGHHQKMRLRGAMAMVVDADLSVADYVIDVKHGGNDVVSAVSSGSTTSAIGTVKVFTIVDQYKDADNDDSIVIQVDTASTTGDVLVFLMYELVA